LPPLPPRQESQGVHLARGQAAPPRPRPDRPEAPDWSLTQRRPRPLRRISTIDGSPGGMPSCSNLGRRLTFLRHIPAVRSPTFATRLRIVFSVNRDGSQRGTSLQPSGAETRASGVGRTEYAQAIVRSRAFCPKSTKTPRRSATLQVVVATS